MKDLELLIFLECRHLFSCQESEKEGSSRQKIVKALYTLFSHFGFGDSWLVASSPASISSSSDSSVSFKPWCFLLAFLFLLAFFLLLTSALIAVRLSGPFSAASIFSARFALAILRFCDLDLVAWHLITVPVGICLSWTAEDVLFCSNHQRRGQDYTIREMDNLLASRTATLQESFLDICFTQFWTRWKVRDFESMLSRKPPFDVVLKVGSESCKMKHCDIVILLSKPR